MRRMPDPARDAPRSYADLTPAAVLDALDAVGLRGDGRILQLNSYENRVFQVMLEDGDAVVAKFYRPGALERRADRRGARLRAANWPTPRCRWSRPACCTARRRGVRLLPVPAAGHAGAALGGTAGLHRYRVSPRQAGRAPGARGRAVLRAPGRLHRPPARGRRAPAASRTGARWTRRATRARRVALLLDGGFVPPTASAALAPTPATRALDCIDAAFAARRRRSSIRLHGDCHPGNLLWRDAGAARRRPRRRLHGPGGAGPVDAAVGRARGRWRGSCGSCCAAMRRSWTSTARAAR